MDTTAGRGNQTVNGLWPPLTMNWTRRFQILSYTKIALEGLANLTKAGISGLLHSMRIERDDRAG